MLPKWLERDHEPTRYQLFQIRARRGRNLAKGLFEIFETLFIYLKVEKMSIEKATHLAQSILVKIKNDFVTRNDIIPLSELPFFYADEIIKNKLKFGNAINLLAQSIINLNLARESSKKLSKAMKEFSKGTVSIYMLQQLAVAYCKIGSCGELTTYALFELLKQFKTENVHLPITFIVLESKEKNLSTGTNYNHACLFIGNTSITQRKNLNELNSLSESIICVDPSIGWVAPVNQMIKINQKFFTAQGIDHISKEFPSVITFFPDDQDVQEKLIKIEKGARFLSAKILDELRTEPKFRTVTLDNKELPKLTEQGCSFSNQNLKKEYEACLDQCTRSLFEDNLSHWKYYPKRHGEKLRPAQILLTIDNKDMAMAVLDHLTRHKIDGLHPTLQRVQDNNKFAVLIVEPNITQLRHIPKIEKAPIEENKLVSSRI